MLGAVAQKDVVLDEVPIAVPQSERAPGLEEQISAEGVAAGLAGDDLELAVAAVEDVVLDQGQRVVERVRAGADAQGLAAVGSEDRAGPEVVVVDAMVVLLACLAVEAYRHRDAGVALALEVVVIEAVVLPVEHHPEVGLLTFGVVEAGQ